MGAITAGWQSTTARRPEQRQLLFKCTDVSNLLNDDAEHMAVTCPHDICNVIRTVMGQIHAEKARNPRVLRTLYGYKLGPSRQPVVSGAACSIIFGSI